MKLESKYKELGQINKRISEMLEETSIIVSDLSETKVKHIENVLSDTFFLKTISKIQNRDYRLNLNFDKLLEIEDSLKTISGEITSIKKEAEIDFFLKDGLTLNEKALNMSFKTKKLKEKYPNINIEKLKDLYTTPPKFITTYYDKELKIIVDEFVFRKFIIAIIQMVFNHMDLLCIYTGVEGSGKSTKASQDMLMVYWLLKEVGIIDYEYNINDMFFNTLSSFQEAEDKFFKDPFRILCLDEGNQLNRQEWSNDEVKTFFQRLRRERFNQRIKFICIPVLGEMLTSIIQNRVNFVFDGYMRNNLKTCELEKGYWNMYIIPRGQKVYSPKQRREISAEEVRTKLHENLKDQNYRKGINSSLVIREFKSNGVWGFKESEYTENLKDSNDAFSVTKGLKLTDTELFAFYKNNVTLKQLGIKKDSAYYSGARHMLTKINKYWETNPNLLLRYEMIQKRKNAGKK